jgi:hypothetical protein
MSNLSFRGNFDTGEFECFIKNEVGGCDQILFTLTLEQINQHHELFKNNFNIRLQESLNAIYKAGYDNAVEAFSWELSKIRNKFQG